MSEAYSKNRSHQSRKFEQNSWLNGSEFSVFTSNLKNSNFTGLNFEVHQHFGWENHFFVPCIYTYIYIYPKILIRKLENLYINK